MERKVGWFSDSRPGYSSLAGGWVGTALSPIPVSPQRAPSFRLSHREGEKLQLSLGAELFLHHFLRRGPGPRGEGAGPALVGPIQRAHSKVAAPGPPQCYLPGAPGDATSSGLPRADRKVLSTWEKPAAASGRPVFSLLDQPAG